MEAATDPIAAGKTTLRLRIQLGPVPDLLKVVGDGRLRVSVAVAHGKDAPFVNHSEMPLARSGDGTLYLYDAPLVVSPRATASPCWLKSWRPAWPEERRSRSALTSLLARPSA